MARSTAKNGQEVTPLLHLGVYEGTGEPFFIPDEAQVQTFGVIGMRGSGKTVLATDMAEEMCKKSLLWIAFDPISVWWGLRADKTGKPGGFPVLVFGGKHGDIPIEKDDGRKIAEVLATENVFAVIDVKDQSKRFWHTFMADLALGLMEHEPETPRHIFLEEAPEFVPQKTRVDLTARCKEAVERLVRLGRNQGYGCTLISQRTATVDKDVLSQCENLFVLRSVGKHDTTALSEWLQAAGISKQRAREEFLKDIASLLSGTAHFWSPGWLREYTKVKIRERETFHPGETRKVGVSAKTVTLAAIHDVVARVQKKLTRVVAQVPSPRAVKGSRALAEVPSGRDRSVRMHEEPVPAMPRAHPETLEELEALRKKNEALSGEVASLRAANREVTAKLETVRKALEPEYRALQSLFSEIGSGATIGAGDMAVYEEWLKKAGVRGCRRILEVMIERKKLRAIQLATLSGISYKTLKNYRGWLKSNGLVEIQGEGEDAEFTLVPLP